MGEWVNAIKDPALQPQFKDVTGCVFKPLLEDKNQWHFVELEERVGNDEDEVDEERQLVLRHVITSIARSIETGKIGAHAVEQRKGKSSEEEPHHLVESIGLPRTEQDEAATCCAWKVDCHWLSTHCAQSQTLVHKVFAKENL